AEVQAKLSATGASPETCNKALRVLQDLKARLASQTSIAQILYMQGQGGDAMDDAITLIESAAVKPVHQVATPGDTVKPVQLGQPNVTVPAAKTTKVIRAAELSSKTYLETEADVNVFVEALKSELMAAVRAGQIARIQ
ncbi:MAG: BREX system P-loop protein BrxC, partial [Rhodoferax sp.]